MENSELKELIDIWLDGIYTTDCILVKLEPSRFPCEAKGKSVVVYNNGKVLGVGRYAYKDEKFKKLAAPWCKVDDIIAFISIKQIMKYEGELYAIIKDSEVCGIFLSDDSNI